MDRYIPEVSIPPRPSTPVSDMMASVVYDRLKRVIESMEGSLSEDEVLYVYYYAQAGEPILIRNIGYQNPFLITLYGFDADGTSTTVVAHMHSVQLVMKRRELADVEEPPQRKIGFTGATEPNPNPQ